MIRHNHSQSTVPRGRPVTALEEAHANNSFEHFLSASTLKTILGTYRNICEHLHLKPNVIPQFYPKLKTHVNSWKAKPLWKKFDYRANQKCYGRGKACPNTRVLIIGAGPCGLRTAIEAQLLGAKVVVVEKRDRMSRNNVLHLWPFVIEDLRMLGAKKFFGKFCAGAIDHISIRQLQCILMKVALLLGVEIHTEVSFERSIEPNFEDKVGWRAEFKPSDHPVSQFEFDVIIGADGKRNTLQGFKRKEFRGKLAIAITANFINKRTEAEARVEEISGVAFIFNQKFFKDLHADTGIDLENIVYYKDDTHYFVMTAKKQSLIEKGVIKKDLPDTARLLALDNVDRDELMNYAREAAEFSTNYQMPDLEFAVNHYGQADVAMFDFTSMYAAENASRVTEKHGYKLLSILVGDSLLEPFWPTGSGCARGFLSSMDAAWAIRSWGSGNTTPLEVLSERESIYRLLAQTTPENLNKDYKSYMLDPSTRYPNLNKNVLLPHQVTSLYDTDDPKGIELKPRPAPAISELSKKRRRRESHVDPDMLLIWIKSQVREHNDLEVANITTSFKDGRVLCAILHHYRPDLLDYGAINAQDAAKNNQLAFDLLEKELGVPPVMSGEEMAGKEVPDYLTMLSYLTQIYDTFRCEIPHIKHPKLDPPETKRNEALVKVPTAVEKFETAALTTTPTTRQLTRHKRHVDANSTQKPIVTTQDRKTRKRKTLEKVGASVEERQKRLEDIVTNRVDRHNKKRQQRKNQTDQFIKSMQMLQSNRKPDHSEPFEDYSIFLYRQTAPNFEDRVKDLEKMFTYVPDRENRLPTQTKRETDEDFAARIKDLEDKWRDPVPVEKKPKDLLRAIGKIETSDWNIKEIEKKIIENKLGKTVNKDKEKVPKWSREQFLARQTKMESKHLERQESSEMKFAEIDKNIKQLEQRLKEGSTRDLNQQKVATITEKFGKPIEPQQPKLEKSNSRSTVLPNQGSEHCHFCAKRVYLMERLTAEGKFFHRGCFRCQYCHTLLRLGSYTFDREGLYGNRFYCTQHFGMSGELRTNKVDKKDLQEQPSGTKLFAGVIGVDLLDRVQTPERIEFSNLSTGHVSSDHEESPSPIDEDEWTDRNFKNSVVDSDSPDDSSSTSETDSDDDEAFEEALEEPATKEGTLRWAERYKRRYSRKQYDDIYSDEYSSSDDSSYCENSSGDEESDTATEGEDEIRARELRKQEVRVEPPVTDTGTDTEVKPLSNLTVEPNDPNLPCNQLDIPDLLKTNNTLNVSKSSDNLSINSNEFNSAESEPEEFYKNFYKTDKLKPQTVPIKTVKMNNLSKSATTSSMGLIKRNFVLPPKDKKSFGKEFPFKNAEPEPLLIIKRTPSKISLPPEVTKPKCMLKTTTFDPKKYFGETNKKPPISKPIQRKSISKPLIKQSSLPETMDEFKPNFNFEPEDTDLKDVDDYIENLLQNKDDLLKPMRKDEKVSSSIEDLLKALETETSVGDSELVAVKPEDKIEDLLSWMEELDHQERKIEPKSKYKNLEQSLKVPQKADSVVSKLSKDHITLFENHMLGKNNDAVENNFQLKRSKTDVYCNKPRTSVDLDAVKKVDIRKVLQKFENNEEEEKEKPKREIVVPKNIVKRNSFANFSFNRSFDNDDNKCDKPRLSIGSKDFKLKTEMFERKANGSGDLGRKFSLRMPNDNRFRSSSSGREIRNEKCIKLGGSNKEIFKPFEITNENKYKDSIGDETNEDSFEDNKSKNVIDFDNEETCYEVTTKVVETVNPNFYNMLNNNNNNHDKFNFDSNSDDDGNVDVVDDEDVDNGENDDNVEDDDNDEDDDDEDIDNDEDADDENINNLDVHAEDSEDNSSIIEPNFIDFANPSDKDTETLTAILKTVSDLNKTLNNKPSEDTKSINEMTPHSMDQNDADLNKTIENLEQITEKIVSDFNNLKNDNQENKIQKQNELNNTDEPKLSISQENIDLLDKKDLESSPQVPRRFKKELRQNSLERKHDDLKVPTTFRSAESFPVPPIPPLRKKSNSPLLPKRNVSTPNLNRTQTNNNVEQSKNEKWATIHKLPFRVGNVGSVENVSLDKKSSAKAKEKECCIQ